MINGPRTKGSIDAAYRAFEAEMLNRGTSFEEIYWGTATFILTGARCNIRYRAHPSFNQFVCDSQYLDSNPVRVEKNGSSPDSPDAAYCYGNSESYDDDDEEIPF